MVEIKDVIAWLVNFIGMVLDYSVSFNGISVTFRDLFIFAISLAIVLRVLLSLAGIHNE